MSAEPMTDEALADIRSHLYHATNGSQRERDGSADRMALLAEVDRLRALEVVPDLFWSDVDVLRALARSWKDEDGDPSEASDALRAIANRIAALLGPRTPT